MERYHIVHDSRGIIWISTYGNGLFAYNTITEELQHFDFQIDGFSTSAPTICNTSWKTVPVLSGSVLNTPVLPVYYPERRHQTHLPEAISLSDRSNTVRMITRLKNDDICIGTRGGGVYTYDPLINTQKKEVHYNSNIYAIAEDLDGTQ